MVQIQISRQPNANVVDTVERIKALMPQFEAQLPPTVRFKIASDRTITTRDSMRDAQRNMIISIGLVILVVFVFLRSGWSTFIPSISVPVSIIATFGAMYLIGYTLDNLSLMALTIATGFVVDDAIVVIENITRHLESGMKPMAGGAQGRRGDRLHRAVDEHLAHRRLHSDPDDERRGGPPVPRIRGDSVGRDRHLDGGLAHRHADDVRAGCSRKSAATAISTTRPKSSFSGSSPPTRRRSTSCWIILRPS